MSGDAQGCGLPAVGSAVIVAAGGVVRRGVVTGHDTKDGAGIFDYVSEQGLPGSVVKVAWWARPEQLVVETVASSSAQV